MARKRHTPDEIVAKLRQVAVLVGQGQAVAEAIRAIGVSEVTYYRWRREFGGLKSDQVKRLRDLEAEGARLRRAVAELTLDKQILAEAARGGFSAPRAGAPVLSLCDGVLPVSERHVCAALGQHRSTPRQAPRGREDEERLTADIIELARQYGRYGYRKITALLRAEGWRVNAKRVERIWRREGLKVPPRQPKRGRLWLADGSCVRLRPERPNHVWAEWPKVPRTQSVEGPRRATTSSRTAPTTAGSSGCSTSSTSSPTSAWPSGSGASCGPPT
jgi:putative transposase